MRCRRSCRLPLFCFAAFVVLCLASSSLALEIEKLVPFAWTNNVRIDASFATTQSIRDADVTAEIRDSDNQLFWGGKLRDISVPENGFTSFSQTISNLSPKLWNPSAPNLYTLKLVVHHSDNVFASKSVRFGFRSFENRKGQFFLNGHPIFLRGVAINPPGRTIAPEVADTRPFAESYVRYMKSQHVNAIRLSVHSQVWFDVCDEMGMMLFQGNYGSPFEAKPRKQAAPENYDASLKAYKNLFETYARHPSIMIYILSNELPTSGKRGAAFHEFLTRACDDLKQWDSTRLYIGNAGYGEGREGDVKDAHRYWGWYYDSFLTYYNLRNKTLFGDPTKIQPLTFTECVGNYTGPRGDYNVIMNRQLAAQLNWTGHSTNQIADALNYQQFMVKQATESFRRLRSLNQHLAGVMPFSIFFYNWSGVKSFEQMKPKPAMEQLGISYSPVLLSWEMWTPNVYAGSTVTAYAHVVNDDDEFRDLENARLIAELRKKNGEVVSTREFKIPSVHYFKTWRKKINFHLPKTLLTGDYIISGRIVRQGAVVSRNETDLFVAPKEWSRFSSGAQVFLFDPRGETSKALRKLNASFQRVENLEHLPEPSAALIIGENSLKQANPIAVASINKFVASGGRVLFLQQDPKDFDPNWLPESIQFLKITPNDSRYPTPGRPYTENMNINPERPGHPVFEGLDRHRLALWSDYTHWNQTKDGFPQVYPVMTGFRLKNDDALARTAILADYDRGLEGVALCEMFFGRGSFIVSGFDLVRRTGFDPCADRLLLNLVRYTAAKENHHAYPLIDSPIVWGDYGSERGLVPGPLNGLLVNTHWIAPPTNPSSKPSSQDGSQWSTYPGDQFVPYGRIPAGPFGYSSGTFLRDRNPSSPLGTGNFWARIPHGKKAMLTKVENSSSRAESLEIWINGESKGESSIPAGASAIINSKLPKNVEKVAVRYNGSKQLVLLETAFE